MSPPPHFSGDKVNLDEFWIISNSVFSGVAMVTLVSMYISTLKLERMQVLLARAVTLVVGLAVVVVHLLETIPPLVHCKLVMINEITPPFARRPCGA